jgi:hypothetical protein
VRIRGLDHFQLDVAMRIAAKAPEEGYSMRGIEAFLHSHGRKDHGARGGMVPLMEDDLLVHKVPEDKRIKLHDSIEYNVLADSDDEVEESSGDEDGDDEAEVATSVV